MLSSRSEPSRPLAELMLALAMLAPLVPLVDHWSRKGPHAGLMAGLLGSLLGVLLARRRARAVALALLVAFAVIWAELGSLWPPLALLRTDLAALLAGEGPVGTTWHWLSPAGTRWLATLQSNRAVLASLGWHWLLVGVTAATLWRLRRDPRASAWPLLVVPVAWLGADVFQDEKRVTGLLCSLAAGASLAVIRHTSAREQAWERAEFAYSDQISREVLAVGIIAVATTVTLAWLSPGLMALEFARPLYKVLNAPWREVNRLSGGRLEALSRRPGPPGGDIATRAPTHRLVGPRVVSDDLLFQVTLPDEPRVLPLRWRTWTLEGYDGHVWSVAAPRIQRSSGVWSERVDAPRRAPSGLRQLVRAAPGHSLVGRGLPAAPGLTWTDGAAAAYLDEDGALVGLRAGRDRFTAVSVPASVLDQEAPYRGVSPEAITLPAGTPPRVRLLARLLAGPDPRPEAMAASLERALRQLRYDTNIPEPPPDRDAVDWFLFEQGRGYCDYFASAFVVMARAVGLPARLVIGFAPGTFDPATRTYFVTGQEAHAWAEVWIDGRGWVEFDPTPAAYTQLRMRATAVRVEPFDPVRPLALIGLIVVAFVGVAMAVFLRRLGGSWRRTGRSDALGAWAAIQERAARLGAPPSPTATPTEQALALAAALRGCVVTLHIGPHRLTLRPPDVTTPLTALAAAYARARYGPPASVPALPGWRRLLRTFWWLVLRRSAHR